MYRPLNTRAARRPDSDVNIVVLSKYVHILQNFSGFIETNAPGFKIVCVKDGDPIKKEDGIPYTWNIIRGPEKFSMAGNANIGWKATNPKADLLYIGDDVQILQPRTVEYLRALAYSDPTIGLLSPRIIGGADNPLQKAESDKDLVYSDRYIALVCTYIKREVIDKVGYLDDETFKGYGWEDCDFSRRVVGAGFKLAVAPKIAVQHGIFRIQKPETREGTTGNGTETFLRDNEWNYNKIQEQADANKLAYEKKWGDTKQEGF